MSKPGKKQKLIFLAIAIALVGFPLYFILRSEAMLGNKENIYRFRPTRLIDPYDMLRGNYLVIDFPRSVKVNEGEFFGNKRGNDVYVLVERDSLGYAFFSGAMAKTPTTENYFKTTTFSGTREEQEIWIDVPFNKYFINAGNAKLAEDLYRLEVRDSSTNMYIDVAINNGDAMLKDVYLDSIPLNEFINRLSENQRRQVELDLEKGNGKRSVSFLK